MSEPPRRCRPEFIRLPRWDYTSAGWYFVTVCVRGGVRALGSVGAAVMRLSPLGEIVADEWLATPRIRPTVRLDEWVVMPNHLHGILILDPEPLVETPRRGVCRGLSPHVRLPSVT